MLFAEVVVPVSQPIQGCSRLESLYYISYIIPHIVGRRFINYYSVSFSTAEHKKAYPNPSCSKVRVVDQEDPEREQLGRACHNGTPYSQGFASMFGRHFEL